MKKLKEKLDSVFDVKSYGYVVDKRITRSAFVLILLLALLVGLTEGWDVFVHGGVYVEADVYNKECGNLLVVNPLCELDQDRLLSKKPSWLAQNFGFLAFSIFGSALGLNHYLNNFRRGGKE